MKVLIDVTEEQFSMLHNDKQYSVSEILDNGIMLTDSTTNGDVLKLMFPDAEVKEIIGSFNKDLLGYRMWLGGKSQDFFLDWWNAPYGKEVDNG